MAKKGSENNTIPEVSTGEIGTIRDILMGHQIAENEARFDAIEARIRKMEENFNTQLNRLDNNSKEQFSLINADLSNKFENFDAILSKSQQSFHEKIDAMRRQEREKLSTLLAQLSKHLLED